MLKKNSIIETLVQRGAEFQTAYRIFKLDKEFCKENHKNPSDSEFYETRFWGENRAIRMVIGDIAETEKEELNLLDKISEKSMEDEFIKYVFSKYDLSLKNADEIEEHIEDGTFKYMF